MWPRCVGGLNERAVAAVKNLTFVLRFTKHGRPIWDTIRIIEWKTIKRNLKARSVERELRHRKTRNARRHLGVKEQT